jgi:hypothetical protein
METIVQVQSVAFYPESKTCYITAEIIKFYITEENHQDIYQFKSLNRGEKISFKSKTSDYKDVLKAVSERLIFINVVGVDKSRDSKQSTSPKLVFDTVKSCEVLPVD